MVIRSDIQQKAGDAARAKAAAKECLIAADKFLKDRQFDKARQQVDKAKAIDPSNPYISAFEERINIFEEDAKAKSAAAAAEPAPAAPPEPKPAPPPPPPPPKKAGTPPPPPPKPAPPPPPPPKPAPPPPPPPKKVEAPPKPAPPPPKKAEPPRKPAVPAPQPPPKAEAPPEPTVESVKEQEEEPAPKPSVPKVEPPPSKPEPVQSSKEDAAPAEKKEEPKKVKAEPPPEPPPAPPVKAAAPPEPPPAPKKEPPPAAPEPKKEEPSPPPKAEPPPKADPPAPKVEAPPPPPQPVQPIPPPPPPPPSNPVQDAALKSQMEEMSRQIMELSQALLSERKTREDVQKKQLTQSVKQFRDRLQKAWSVGAPKDEVVEEVHSYGRSLGLDDDIIHSVTREVKLEMYGRAVKEMLAKRKFVRSSSSTMDWLRKVYQISMAEYLEYESRFLMDLVTDQFRGTLLLVAGTDSVRREVSAKMKASGFAVVMALAPEEALEKIERVSPTIIMTETQFPGRAVSGVMFLQLLRANPKFSYVPVMLLAEEQEAVTLASSELRDIEGIVKVPVDFDEINAMINEKLAILRNTLSNL